MSEKTSSDPVPKKPRKRRARANIAAAAPKAPNEFAGVTARLCPSACTAERCVISTVSVCKHPAKTGDSGCGPVTLRNRESVKKILKRQAVDAA